MIKLDELKQEMPKYKETLKLLGESMKIDDLREKSQKMEKESTVPGFWDDQDQAKKVLQEKGALDSRINAYDALVRELADMDEMIELAEEMGDEDEADQILEEAGKLSSRIDDFKISTLMNGKYDHNSAILTLHAGTGGVDAMDWTQMLLRMYTRWAEDHGFKVDVADVQDDTEAGIKSATFIVDGENAYGYLKREKGVHRLVRISPFNSAGKRQTSFAALEVMPEIDDTVTVDINPDDLKIDVYRSSGAGGQHINKSSTAIRITHLPTNIVVTCQNERSQFQNKAMAMKILYSRLMDLKEQQHKQDLKEIKGDFSQITWGSQIRSYVFQPYTMVKDHRTGVEVGNVNAVMDGGIDPFIKGELTQLTDEA
ncbi:MAG: peptide chain release factor 2 [Eubacteriales bacterium]|nr:peptide chain release factor 2 [Eubacteriales bacterium]